MAKLSEKQKTVEFERTVLTGTVDEIKAKYQEVGPIELPARSLGMACRFRGLEVVKTLVELGLFFHRPTEPSFRGKYDCGYTSAGRYQVTSDYLLLLLDDCDCQSSFGIHSGYRDRYSGKYTDEAFNNLQMVSEEERSEIIEYLFQNKKSAHFQADKLLYYSILSQNDFAIRTLKSLGVVIPSHEKEYLTDGGTGLDFQDYQKSLFRNNPKELKKQFEYWFAELKDNEKLIIYKTYAEEYADILFSPEVYSFIKDRTDFSKVSKKNILMKLVENNNAAAVTVLCNDGWVEKKTLRDSLISAANEKGSVDALAVLIDYKNRTSDPIKEREDEDRKLMQELNANPMSVASLKKQFAYETLPDGTYRITRYKGDQTMVTVPEKIGKTTVTAIGEGAFSSDSRFCKNEDEVKRRIAITDITLPDSVDTIERCAFSDCTGLTYIKLSQSLKTIEESAFRKCVKLAEIDLPESITQIGNNAFSDCSSLTHLELPNSILTISYSAFSGCESLKEVSLPANLESISSYAFYECKSLESVDLPDSLKVIGGSAFTRCNCLSEVNIPESIERIDCDFGDTKWAAVHANEPFYYNDILISNKGACGKVEIKGGTRIVAGYAFAQSDITSVTIPDSVVQICDGAFSNCKSLKEVDFGNGIKSIGNGAFTNCEALETIVIPKSVTRIGNPEVFGSSVFWGCNNIKDLYIPAETTEVCGIDCLLHNKDLTIHTPVGSAAESIAATRKVRVIHDTPDNPSEEAAESENFVLTIDNGELKSCYGTKSRVEINETVIKVGHNAFANNKDVTEVVLPDTVTSIGYYSFMNCENLKHFEAPQQLTSMGKSAFEGCKQLESVVLNEKLNEVSERAFRNCVNLKKIVIPASVKRINSHAFENCKRLEEIVFKGKGISFGDHYANRTFSGCESLKTITIPISDRRWYDSLEEMFINCTSLESVCFTKDSNFTTIYPRMFAGCSRLKEIEIPECVETFAEDAFDGCAELKRLFLSNEKIWKKLPTSIKNLYISGVAYKICNNTANDFELNEVLPYIRKQKKRLLESMPDNHDLIQVLDSDEAKQSKNHSAKASGSQFAVSENDHSGDVLNTSPVEGNLPEDRVFQGKKFVTTGLTAADERWVQQEVESRGGEYKPKFVVSLDFLIYNPDYDHETVKLTRAREQVEKGKPVHIITLEAFKKLI